MPENPLQKLYANLKDDGYELGSYDDFKVKMSSEDNRDKLYKNLSDDGYSMPSAGEYNKLVSRGLNPNDYSLGAYLAGQRGEVPDISKKPASLDEAIDQDDENAGKDIAKTATLQQISKHGIPKDYDELVNGRLPAGKGLEGFLSKVGRAKDYTSDQLTKGVPDVIAGAANAVNDMMANAPVQSYQPLGGNGQTIEDIRQQRQEDRQEGKQGAAAIQNAREGVNNALLSPNHEANAKEIENAKGIGGSIARTVGGFAHFIPQMATAGVTGGASLFFGGYQAGLDQVAGNDKIDPGMKSLYALGYGAVNTALMSLPIGRALDKGLTDKIASKVALESLNKAFHETGGKLTGDAFMNVLNNAKTDAINKLKIGGVKAAKGFAEGAIFSAAQQGAEAGLQHGLNSLEGKKVFETPDFKHFVENVGSGTLSLGMLNFATGGFHSSSKDYIKNVVAAAKRPEDIAALHDQIDAMQQKGKLTEPQATELHKSVNAYTEIKKTLPPTMSDDQGAKVFDLIKERDQDKAYLADLHDQLKADQDIPEPSLRGLHTDDLNSEIKNTQTAIEVKNDQIREVATGQSYKYFQKDGQYFKTLGDGKPEPISKELYELRGPQPTASVENPVVTIENPVTGEKAKTSIAEDEFGDKSIETPNAIIEGHYGDEIDMDDQQIKLPKPGLFISDVSLKEGSEKGKGHGQEAYKEALDQYGVLYSAHPVSEDAIRAQEALVRKGIATIHIEDIGGNPVRMIEKFIPAKEVKPENLTPKPEMVKQQPTFAENEGRMVNINGERGMLEKEGQGYVINTPTRIHDIGNAKELKDQPLADHGITPEKEEVFANEDGSLNVRGKDYQNNYSDPLAAINHDADGNVQSVNLDTPDGKKRTFRGQTAEDIAYHITLKELDKNNDHGEFEDYINSEPEVTKEMEHAEVPETTKKNPNENNAEIPEKQEPVKKEGGQNAVQVEKPNEVDVRQQAENGEGVGSQNEKSKKPTEKGEPETKKVENSEPLIIFGHESDNAEANSKLSNEEAVEQEPDVKSVERKAETASKTPEVEGGIAEADKLINEATDVKRVPLSDIHTDEGRFQGREKLNDAVVKRIAAKWSDADQDPIQIWKDPKDGKYYVLSGHHRLAAAKLAGRSDIKVIDRSADFTPEQAKKFATEEANANRTMETPLERAQTLRKKRENGDSREEIKGFLEKEGRNASFVDNLSRLNPKGKTVNALKSLAGSDDKVTQKEVERIADWIGAARKANGKLTDAHENEMFDFLMNRDASSRIKNKADFIHKVVTAFNDMDPTEPLNLIRFKYKNAGEEAYEKAVADLKGEIDKRQQQINDLNDRFKSPDRKDYVPTDHPDYDDMKALADKKRDDLNTEIKGLQKKLQDLYSQKGKYTDAGGQQSLFQEPDDDSVYRSDVVPFVREFVEHDIMSRLGKAVTRFGEITKFIREFLSPLTKVNERGKTAMFKMLGSRELANEKLDGVLHSFENMFNKMDDGARVDFIDRMKTGRKQRSPELQKISDMLRNLDDDLFKSKEEAANLNHTGISLAWKENHFRVWWKKIPGSDKEGRPGVFRRPMQGTKGSFKHATLVDISEGIEKGGEPVSTNPIKLFKLSYNDDMKYITAQRMWREIGDLGLRKFVRFGKDVPDGFVKIDDSISKVWFPVKEGMVNAGEWYVDEGVARMINNHFGKDRIRSNPIGKTLLELKNFWTAIELGLSGYHAVAESIEVMSSSISLGLRKIINLGTKGHWKEAMGGIGDLATFVKSPVTYAKLGREAIRMTKSEDFRNSKLGKSFMKKFPDAEQYMEDFFNAGGLFEQNRDFKVHTFQAIRDAAEKNNYIGATIRMIPTANKMMMQPLFEYYIPALKVGMFMKEYPVRLLEKNPSILKGITTREQLARELVSFIDDRLGETNFDAKFWDRTFKSSMQLLFRSITWKVGNISAFAGAPIEQAMEFAAAAREHRAPNLDPKMAWLLGLIAVQTAMSYTIMNLFTGKSPKNIRDLVAPQIDPNDPSKRVIIPSYIKDALHAYHSPSRYVSTSMSGMWGKLLDDWNNKDFYGYEIYDPQASLPERAKEIAEYSVPKPFSISSFMQMGKEGQSFGKKALGFFGFVKAPSYIVNSPIENEIFDLYHIRDQGVKPYQDRKANDIKKEARTLYKEGYTEKAEDLLSKAIKDGVLRETQVKYLMRNVGKTDDASVYIFRMLPRSDKEYLYSKMTKEEKEKYDPKGKLNPNKKPSNPHAIVTY